MFILVIIFFRDLFEIFLFYFYVKSVFSLLFSLFFVVLYVSLLSLSSYIDDAYY